MIGTTNSLQLSTQIVRFGLVHRRRICGVVMRTTVNSSVLKVISFKDLDLSSSQKRSLTVGGGATPAGLLLIVAGLTEQRSQMMAALAIKDQFPSQVTPL
ncbi:hypothetical protein AABB24_020779 [Solanum stoloniferum]|uniref:Uncharacterized protein n=1 Tax=Solanum stoloniferum TaxID=62892 RepID=A0ABD2T9U6_9SOLN